MSPARPDERSETDARESGGVSPGLHGMRLAEMEEDWGNRLIRTGAKPLYIQGYLTRCLLKKK